MSLRYKSVSLSLHGQYYVFCGPRSNAGWTPWQRDGHHERYAVIGEGQSWYRHWHDANDRCMNEWSGNLEVEYPFLARRLDTEKHLGCPTCISLGPNGTYFANFGGRSFWSLPDAIKDGLDMDSVDRLFLGRSSAYYAVYQGGSARWRLSGNYSYSDDLSNYLKEAKSPAKALAFNLVDSSWAVINEGGGYKYCEGAEWTRGNDFKRWRDDNGN